MVIFLYGEDSYRSKQKLDEIIGQYRKVRTSGLNLMHVDASQADFTDFMVHVKSSSMFAETKLVILKNVFADKVFQEALTENIKPLNALKDVVVIYESSTPDQRLKLFKLLIKECKNQEFNLLEGRELKMWAVKEFEALGQKINVDALELLIASAGKDLWRASSEVQKLSAYKKGQTIKKEDVALQVKANIEMDIFKTIDALAQKDKKQALALLQKHLDGGDNPLYLLSMVAYQFRNLLVVKELAEKGLMYASIVKKSGLHPFVVKKSYFACSQFSFDYLKQLYRKIFQIDADIKTGKIEPETALEIFVATI